MTLKPPSASNDPTEPATTGGNARVLVWDGTSYEPALWRSDTSVPREFVGPTNPAEIVTVTLTFADRWTPTES